MKNLKNVPVDACTHTPLVSIIVPACNEEKTLEPALRSLLHQNYLHREIIVIDDRSTDGTFALMKKLAREFSEIKVEHITELPPGWLGKNHALWWGARVARGDVLLFTDADIIMEPSTLSRAVSYLVDEKLDHLSLVFRNVAQGCLLNAMVVDALGGLFFLLRPWNVRNPASRAFIGIGAFNMILSQAYWKLGGHSALKMHPIDDVMLGKKVKQQGMSQDCLLGGSFVRVRWYRDIPEMTRGLMKNIFALYSYRIDYVAAGLAGIIALTIVPVWGIFLTQGVVRIFLGLTVLCRFALFVCNARGMKIPSTSFFCFLLTPYFIGYIIVKSVWVTLKNKGIDWRGTYYSLQELKQQEPLLSLADIIPYLGKSL